MSQATCLTWSPADYCFSAPAAPTAAELAALAQEVYEKVCRTDTTAPGFCLIDLGQASSIQLRRTMVEMASAIGKVHLHRQGQDLALISAARFDQQVTTKLHRDGGPDRSLLLLGYESSEIGSELLVADYSLCAANLGLTPGEFLARHNPMYAAGEQRLAPYVTRVTCFQPGRSQLVVINNSLAPAAGEGPVWQGVLHAARVLQSSPDKRRVINSMMAASVPRATPPPISAEQIAEFTTTSTVHRRGYDKLELADDE